MAVKTKSKPKLNKGGQLRWQDHPGLVDELMKHVAAVEAKGGSKLSAFASFAKIHKAKGVTPEKASARWYYASDAAKPKKAAPKAKAVVKKAPKRKARARKVPKMAAAPQVVKVEETPWAVRLHNVGQEMDSLQRINAQLRRDESAFAEMYEKEKAARIKAEKRLARARAALK